jgi:hypothetical protein
MTVLMNFYNRLIQRLIVYVFAHLKHCVSDTRWSCLTFYGAAFDDIGRLFNSFKATVQQWNSWDIVTMLENHQMIKDHLTDMVQEHLQVCLGGSLFCRTAADDLRRAVSILKTCLQNY